ncbi:putative cytochrome P450 [Actinoplanes missouriensis 431]|uniref:Putative cytochrome P450 n=1 Tax=Actinoplanes missouriensis (strain ATCC 14538 / DSM 43046 / CBS 188.64 / JCM 3121 / NBRC 102363 / NCIMB 12654 / NRRL B-3342 / UNCC 431) TaxID=512565 RepID=I0GZ52_ACTM4|nr:cytochrome P450 [Actinoplanes missouriensis]BAL86039.1 putative cytochrome P450 [Actinoplanes missouriensis 431]
MKLGLGKLPVSHADPFDHDNLEDPGPLHEALREAGPVVHLSRYDTYALARYQHVHAALTDWQAFQSAAGVGLSNFRYEKPWRPPSLLLEADPPQHDAPRRVLSATIGPRSLHRLRDQWAAAADDLVDRVLSHGDVIDAVPALAEAFPLRVFPDAVGIPDAGRENLLPYGDHLFNAFGPPNDLVDAGSGRIADLSAWVNAQCAREVLTPDGFGAAIWAAADRGDLTHEQAPLVVRSLLSAGVDTTVHGLSAVLYAFATNPVQWQRLREQPALARVAFDEAVRWESPVQTFFRTATTDVEIGDTVIPDGAKILMFLGAANRDPRRWGNPDRFDLSRDPSGHVGFGMGIHQCVGQHIARLEAESVLTALARRVSRIELAGPVHRHHNNTLRAWRSIPVQLHRK